MSSFLPKPIISILNFFKWILIFLSVILPAYYGWTYYELPIQERPYHELHHLLKPGGFTGHWYGVAGSLLMLIGVVSYSMRKRARFLYQKGPISAWMNFHIFCCLVGPILVIWHTAFKVNGLVSISFWSMILVLLSGIIGRFFYAQIPRAQNGVELDIESSKKEIENLTHEIFAAFKTDDSFRHKVEQLMKFPEGLHDQRSLKTIQLVFMDDFNRLFTKRKVMNVLEKEFQIPKNNLKTLSGLMHSRALLARKLATVKLFRSLLHYWHVFHLPFALIMLIIMLIHVGVALWMGYGYNLL